MIEANKKYVNVCCIIMGILVIVIYIFMWFTVSGTFHIETIDDMSNYVSGGMHGIKDLVYKCFNLQMIEHGEYRPRIGAFIIQYLDIKLWMKLNTVCNWGGHYPLVLMGIPCTIIGVMLLAKYRFQNTCKSFSFLVGCFCLFLPNYLSESFVFLRTAKLLTPAISLCIFGFIVNYHVKRNLFLEMLIGMILSWICTIDEQLIMVCGFLLGGFLIIEFSFHRNHISNIRILISTIIWYLCFYFGYGRWLFYKYTSGSITEHFHTFRKAFEEFHVILSIIVGTYITKILVPMLLYPKLHNIAYV